MMAPCSSLEKNKKKGEQVKETHGDEPDSKL